ncbi:hypothetical protein [Phenylobacterium sp.]|uniref:hypothetical protein n=1 Tax=Phenylobacterium sp. TaxID=1871053 RepID=UPI0025EA31F7|nr:hypothetical protein [Phenylobacterium sp.]
MSSKPEDDDTNYRRILAGLKEVAEIEAGQKKPARVYTPARQGAAASRISRAKPTPASE